MMRSFVRLAGVSVLASWAIGAFLLVLYGRSIDWTEEQARRQGVFLVHDLIAAEPPAARDTKLESLVDHFEVPFAVVPLVEVERIAGQRPQPGEVMRYEEFPNGEWYFLAFADGQGALMAGPINPAVPRGTYLPIGVILLVILLPLILAYAFVRLQRELLKVQRASHELGAGVLEARVDNPTGPSNELAQSFNEMADRIERLISSRDELVQAVSHELGSPLSRLRFHLELLQSAPDEGEERFAAMTRELDALEDLVAELLRYVQSYEARIEVSKFDPAQNLADLAELARLEIPDDRALTLEVSAPEAITVEADPRLFQRAIENLLRNAVRYGDRQVQLEVTEDDESVRVAVHDDGPGIPADLREKVLAPFMRLEADRARKTGGVGLGLAIVNRIMHRHGGRVAIDRSPLGGAKVTTIWPRQP